MRYSRARQRTKDEAGGPVATALLAVAVVAGVAACGSGAEAGGDGGDGGDGGTEGASVVSTGEVDGVGTVLVGADGRTLYFAEQEADGEIRCVDACLDIWVPVEASGDLPDGIDGLDTVVRDDTGSEQLTYEGAPLYTFAMEQGDGQARGDGLSDTFDGVDLTWHAAVTEARPGGSGTPDDEDSGGGTYDY